ncbi:SAF domain-containing protein [Nocardioides sp. SYSU DS0651]|uniref:SAF domain-containing protein n=1 Tax=Nocardioides sp. SYSU DS0651 TaxID=3415955 RepID=UPI003F4C2705
MDPRDPSARPRRRLADALTAVRRRLLRRRRLIAAALVAVAVAAALHTVAPPPPETRTILVAARDLPAGEAITADDLAEARLPPGVVPRGLAREPVGRLLAAPLRRGEPVTDVRLVGSGLAEAGTAGTVAVPVRLSDAGQAALLGVGDRIDLVATDPQARTSEVVARGATVLAVPNGDRAADGALPGRLVVLALRSWEQHRVTTAAVTAFVTYLWAPG